MIEASKLLEIANWARELDPDHVDRARAGIVIKQYPAGSTVHEFGLPSDSWIGVIDGLMKMRILAPDGREVSLAGLHAGGWFGEGSVLKGEPRRYEILALRDVTLAVMDRKTFFWLFENSLPFNQFLVRQLNQRLGQFIGQVIHDRILSTTARVARTISTLFDPALYPDAGDSLEITQEEIGLIAGLTRPVTNQALRALETRELIRLEYGKIVALDIQKLAALTT